MKEMLLLIWLTTWMAVTTESHTAFLVHHPALTRDSISETFFVKENPAVKQIEPSAATGSSQAVVVEEVPLAHTARFLPFNKKGDLVGKADVKKQVNQVLSNISLALEAANSKLENVVKINVYLQQAELMPQVQEQFSRKFQGQTKPAVSFVVGDLGNADALVAMDAIATADFPAGNKEVKYFQSAAIYSQSPAAHVSVLPVGGVVYVAGQADKGALKEATSSTLKQLAATLDHLGLKKEHVVQIKSFTRPMADVEIVEKELAEFFKGSTVPPVVYVDWLSKDPVVEIELIAASPTTASTTISQLQYITPPFMTASPVYSKVARINQGKKVYVSGLYGKTTNDAQAELTEIFTQLDGILKKAGSDFNHLAKATYYVSNDQTSARLNEIRPKYYDPKTPPAASKAMVRGVGMPGKGITLDMIGVVAK